MKTWSSVCAVGIWAALACCTAHAQVPSEKGCADLKQLKLANAVVDSAEVVAAANTKLPAPLDVLGEMKLPQYCRVKATATPTPDSKIQIEVWMPLSTWNGEFLQIGNGGLAGSINSPVMMEHVSHNFAVAATDDGHTGAGVDGSWAMGHPEKVIDFGYRAVHETSDKSKQIVAAFYGKPAKYAYFNGCSEGGREAMMEAQRYPEDFDGILAGSSAHSWMQLMTAFAWNSQALMKDPASYIPEAKRPAVENAALAACGTQDGVTDKFVKDPLACKFDPAVLLCKGADGNDCLTAPQVKALKSVYDGAHNSAGEKIAAGYEPGGEAEPGLPGISFSSYVFGPAPMASLDVIFSSAFYGSFVFEKPKYSVLDLNFDTDIPLAAKKVGSVMDATNPDLQAFKAHHGKLLQYHGWLDGSPSPLLSVEYYRRAESAMGGEKATQDFYRLFMAPGVMHCGEGPGPNSFGNMLDDSHYGDPDHDVFAALRVWVEQGKAPASVVATKYTADDPTKPVLMTRPLCPFPAQAKWSGKGSSDDAANFKCVSAREH